MFLSCRFYLEYGLWVADSFLLLFVVDEIPKNEK